MKKKLKPKKPIIKPISFERENYLQNRDAIMEGFRANLLEVQQDKPSVNGKICGKDYQEFALIAIFRDIIEQEEYIDLREEEPTDYVDVKEEKALLRKMIKEAKAVFGEDYDKLYARINKDNE